MELFVLSMSKRCQNFVLCKLALKLCLHYTCKVLYQYFSMWIWVIKQKIPFYLNFHVTTSLVKSLEPGLDNYQLFQLYACGHIWGQGPWVCLLPTSVGEVQPQGPREPSNTEHDLVLLLYEEQQIQSQESGPVSLLVRSLQVKSTLMDDLPHRQPENNSVRYM